MFLFDKIIGKVPSGIKAGSTFFIARQGISDEKIFDNIVKDRGVANSTNEICAARES